ncbi:MAG: hypothetical protein Q4A52_07870 [Bacillota bacterium]|nr:hypothetical protein [Bacillota bacterium]
MRKSWLTLLLCLCLVLPMMPGVSYANEQPELTISETAENPIDSTTTEPDSIPADLTESSETGEATSSESSSEGEQAPIEEATLPENTELTDEQMLEGAMPTGGKTDHFDRVIGEGQSESWSLGTVKEFLKPENNGKFVEIKAGGKLIFPGEFIIGGKSFQIDNGSLRFENRSGKLTIILTSASKSTLDVYLDLGLTNKYVLSDPADLVIEEGAVLTLTNEASIRFASGPKGRLPSKLIVNGKLYAPNPGCGFNLKHLRMSAPKGYW